MNKIKVYLPILGLLAILAFIYRPSINELIYDWSNDDNYSHGFLIPVLAGWFVWQKKDELQQMRIKPNLFGLVFLLFGLAMLIAGTASAEWFLTRSSMIIVLAGITLYWGGVKIFKAVWFPLLFLFFMIPIPYVIYYNLTFPMQLFASKASTFLLQATGFSILRQGNILHLANYSLEVAEACSGLRSLMTLTALGAAMAYMLQTNPVCAFLHFAASVPIAIGANVFRILMTAYGAVLISPDIAEGFLHEISGLVVFVIGFATLGITGIILSKISKLFTDEKPVTMMEPSKSEGDVK